MLLMYGTGADLDPYSEDSEADFASSHNNATCPVTQSNCLLPAVDELILLRHGVIGGSLMTTAAKPPLCENMTSSTKPEVLNVTRGGSSHCHM